MESIETYTEEENSENNFARFFDKNGNPVPKSHVYCKTMEHHTNLLMMKMVNSK